MKNLSVDWLKGVSSDRKANLETAIRNDTLVLGRLQEIVKGWEDEIRRAEVNPSVYDSPSWSAKQAHQNGDLFRIKRILDLLSFLNGDRT